MFGRTTKTGLILSAIITICASCSSEATVTAEPGSANGAPGLIGESDQDSRTDNAPPIVDISQDDMVVSDNTGKVDGDIATETQLDTYTFQASDDQTIYLVETGGCEIEGGDSLAFEFKGAASGDGTFADVGDGIDCESVSDIRTDSSGAVQLTISSTKAFDEDTQSTGKYSFRIIIVSDPTPVQLNVGDVVSPDMPELGAGTIEHLGQADLYTFAVSEGAIYEIVGQGGCKVENGDAFEFEIDGVQNTRVDGSTNFDEQSADSDCNEIYRFEVSESGTARMEVSSNDPKSTGTYSFRLRKSETAPATTTEVGDTATTPTAEPDVEATDDDS